MMDEYLSHEAVDRWFALRWRAVAMVVAGASAGAVLAASLVELWKALL